MIVQGLNAGKSQRRIAAELGYDEGTIRRDLQILLLPDSYLKAILTGATAEKYLRSERYKAAENAMRLQLAAEKEAAEKSKQQRIGEEMATACHSDALASLLLRWLRRNLSASYAEQLMNLVDPGNWSIGDQPTTPCSQPAKTLAFCMQGELPDNSPEVLEFYVSALLTALPLIAPERLIRDRAIEKAKRVAESSSRY
jgi:hypothetical protein